jgi:hypothetical protein
VEDHKHTALRGQVLNPLYCPRSARGAAVMLTADSRLRLETQDTALDDCLTGIDTLKGPMEADDPSGVWTGHCMWRLWT